MNVEVLFFAQLKEALGRDAEVVAVPDGGTVADVLALLGARGEWRPVASVPLSYAVNERIVSADHPLRDGDRLALLAPVSGG